MVSIRDGVHLGWCPFGMVSIRDSVHSGLCPFGMVSIRDGVHSGLCPFGIVSVCDCVHSGLCPFGMVPIRDGVHSGLCPFGIVSFGIEPFVIVSIRAMVRIPFSNYAKWVVNFSDQIFHLKFTKSFQLLSKALKQFNLLKKEIANASLSAIDKNLLFVVECDASEMAISGKESYCYRRSG